MQPDRAHRMTAAHADRSFRVRPRTSGRTTPVRYALRDDLCRSQTQILRSDDARSGGYPVSSPGSVTRCAAGAPDHPTSTSPGGTRDRDPRRRRAGRRRPCASAAVRLPPQRRSSSRTGAASPAGRTSPRRSGARPSGSARHCVKNIAQLRGVARRPGRRPVLRRHRGRHRARRDDVDAPAAADAQHDGAGRRARRPRLAHRGVLRRPGAPLHAAGVLRPAYRVDQPPARDARLAARARDVGGRGPDPPLPDQGARRAAAHVPAVLRPLHAHGPRRQLHPARSRS